MADCKTLRGWFNRWFHGDKPAKEMAWRELQAVVGKDRTKAEKLTRYVFQLIDESRAKK